MSTTQRTILVALLAVIGACAAGLVLLATRDPGRASDAATAVWAGRISACETQFPFDGHLFPQPFADCVHQVWTDAVDTGQVQPVSAAFLQAQQHNPSIGYVCHRQGHYAGVYAVERGYPIDDVLTQGDGDQCGGGFVHGALGAYATSGVDAAELGRVAARCAQQTTGTGQAHCTHGIGHAAWVAYPDPQTALTVCNSAGDALSEPCLSGLFMQIFRPDAEQSITSDAPTMTPAAGTDVLADWCSYDTLTPAVAASCWQLGFSQVITLDAMKVTDTYVGDRSRENLKAAQQAWMTALDRCSIAPDETLKTACREWVATSVALGVIEFPETLEQLCPAFPDDLVPFCDRSRMATPLRP